MPHLSPIHPRKTAKCRMLLFLVFLTLPFVCHSAATADSLRYDGYYLSDVPHPTVKGFTAPAKPQYEYIKFYPDGTVTWVMISSNPDPKALKQLFDAFLKDAIFSGRYTRDGDSVQVSIPMGYFQATGRSGADTLELQETLVEQNYSQQYHFVVLAPPAANEPSQPKAPSKTTTAAELRYDGYYAATDHLPSHSDPRVRDAYEYLRFYEDGAMTWMFGDKDIDPDLLMKLFDTARHDATRTGRYTRDGDAIQLSIAAGNGFPGFQASAQIGADSLESQEKFGARTFSQKYVFVPAPPPPAPDPPTEDDEQEEK